MSSQPVPDSILEYLLAEDECIFLRPLQVVRWTAAVMQLFWYASAREVHTYGGWSFAVQQ
jgi:hypothetical protein